MAFKDPGEGENGFGYHMKDCETTCLHYSHSLNNKANKCLVVHAFIVVSFLQNVL